MTAAFAKKHSRGKVKAESANTMLANEVNPVVVQVMREKGTDLSPNKPKLITNKMFPKSRYDNCDGMQRSRVLSRSTAEQSRRLGN